STIVMSALFPYSNHHQHQHSFPTRRSSDLESDAHQQEQAKEQQQGGKVEGHLREKTGLLGFDNVFEFWPGLQGTYTTGRCRGCRDRKSTRLNSSHLGISYAVFCLKKKKKNK